MKIWKKGLIGIGIGILVALVGVGIWQRENAKAIWEGMSYSEDELKTQMETSKEKIQDALKEYEIEGIRELTVEEEEQLMKGELSVEEAVSLILNQANKPIQEEEKALDEKHEVNQPSGSTENNALSQNNGTSSNNGSSSNNSTQSQGSTGTSTESGKTEVGQIVEKYVEKMYTLQATFLSELGGIEARARAAFAALPESERNLSTAKKLAPSFINQGLALESSCDSQVNTILNNFEAELKKAGASTTIVSSMREAYQTQKRLKKAYYLSAIK